MGEGEGGEQSGLPASPVFPNSSAGLHMFNMQGAVSGEVCPEPLGFFPLTWSTEVICAAPRTPPGLFSQPPAVRHRSSQPDEAARSLPPSQHSPHPKGYGREILTFAKYCFEWPLCVSFRVGLFLFREKTFLSVSHSDS